MSYKTIAVLVDNSARVRTRLAITMKIAMDFDAHLTAVYSVFRPDPQTFVVMAGSSEFYATYEEDYAKRVALVRHLFEAECHTLKVKGAWAEAGSALFSDAPTLNEAKCADLIVLGQEDPDDPESYIGDHFAENLVMSAGRPVLMIPFAGTFDAIGREVMIAWDGSREATRAVHDAMPLLTRASHVTVVTVDEARDNALGNHIPGARIAEALLRHRVNVDVTTLDGVAHSSIGETLLSQAYDLNADLLVMGAYGHARWRERVLGGATRTVMASATLPVLLSH